MVFKKKIIFKAVFCKRGFNLLIIFIVLASLSSIAQVVAQEVRNPTPKERKSDINTAIEKLKSVKKQIDNIWKDGKITDSETKSLKRMRDDFDNFYYGKGNNAADGRYKRKYGCHPDYDADVHHAVRISKEFNLSAASNDLSIYIESLRTKLQKKGECN